MPYKVIDHRDEQKPKEVCRVCGSTQVHTKEYNKPTMGCIRHLRSQIPTK